MFVRSPVGERDVIKNVISCRCSERLPLTNTRILLYRSVLLTRHFGRLLIERELLCKAFSPVEPHQGDCKNHCHNPVLRLGSVAARNGTFPHMSQKLLSTARLKFYHEKQEIPSQQLWHEEELFSKFYSIL